MSRKHVGVMAIPNRCSECGLFKPWADLVTSFVSDTDYSSEDDSYRECKDCIRKRREDRNVEERLMQ